MKSRIPVDVAHLPDKSVVAVRDLVFIKNWPRPDLPWRGTDGSYRWNSQVQELLDGDPEAVLLRYGSDMYRSWSTQDSHGEQT